MKGIILLIFCIVCLCLVSQAQATVSVPTTTYFYVLGQWVHFTIAHTFTTVERIDGIWYFDGATFWETEYLSSGMQSSPGGISQGGSFTNDSTFPYVSIVMIGVSVFLMIFGPLFAIHKMKRGELDGLGYGLVMTIVGLGIFIGGLLI